MKSLSAKLGKLRWLLNAPAFRKNPFRVFWNVLIWEWLRIWNREVSFLFDDTFPVKLRPKEGVSRLTFYFGTSEPDLFAFYDAYLRDGMTVIDAGANVGLHTLFIARRVAPSGRVFSFEASPQNFGRLLENVARSSLKNVSAYPAALGDEGGKVFFSEDSGDSSRSHISQTNSGVTVDMVRLDDVCRKESIGIVDFLKLDVEGCELKVLRGAERLFSIGACRMLQVELDVNNLGSQGEKEGGVEAWLLERGYRAVFWDQCQKKFLPVLSNSRRFYNSFFVSPSFVI